MTVKQATSLLTPSTVDLIRSAWAGVGIKVAGPVVVPVPQPPVPEPPPAPPPSSPSPTRQQVVGALDAGFAELARKNNGPFRQFVQAVLTQAKPTLEEAVSKPFAGQAEGQPLTFENFFDR